MELSKRTHGVLTIVVPPLRQASYIVLATVAGGLYFQEFAAMEYCSMVNSVWGRLLCLLWARLGTLGGSALPG